MDHDLIYAKTATGERAMLQRTRAMQRNVRMVLILVDSQSNVGDLCLKTGNPQLTENALLELEEGGFIKLRTEPDSLWEEGNKVAQEIRAAAGNKKEPFARAKTANEHSTPRIQTSLAPANKAPAPSDWSISKTSQTSLPPPIFPDGQASQAVDDSGARKLTEPPPTAEEHVHRSFAEGFRAFFTRTGGRLNTIAQRTEAARIGEEQRPPAPAERFESSVLTAGEEHASLQLPAWTGGAPSWPAIAIRTSIGALALVLLTALLFPYESYLPELEAAFSNAIDRPVKVASLRLEIYPKPALLLGDVSINDVTGEIHIAEIRLVPLLGTLMAKKKILRAVSLNGISLSPEMIVDLPRIIAALSDTNSGVAITRLFFENAGVSLAGLVLSGMSGEAILSAESQLQSLTLRSADRRLSLAASPLKNGFDLDVEGIDWRPSPASPFILNSLNLHGAYENDALSIRTMELRLFDGSIEGAAVLKADERPRIAGTVVFKRINASRLGDALGLGSQFSGEASGKIRFTTSADSWPTIFTELDADGEFSVQRGSIRGIDLAEAARSASQTPTRGGATQFENLSGTVSLTPTNYRFSELLLNSGLMQSTGHLDVSRELGVSGTMELRMRGTVNQTRVPIAIEGSLKSPTVRAGRG